jgi:3-hydroxyisobutyrate dehydrogenase
MRRGAILLDCTSGDHATSRRIATMLRDHGVAFVDAPVSGGVKGAVEGTLTVMCGGEAADIDRVRPVIAAFGKTVVHCGPVGAGDAVKAGNQALLALTIWGTGEVLTALAKAGVSADVALQVINASSGRSNASMNLFPERVLTRAFPRTFRLALMDKDVRIAAQIARDEKVPAPLTQLVADLCTAAHRELGEEADHVETVQVIERWAGAQIS